MNNKFIALFAITLTSSVISFASGNCPVNPDKGLKGKAKVIERSAVSDAEGKNVDGYCWIRADFGDGKRASGLANLAKHCSNLVKGKVAIEVAPGCCEPRSTEFPCSGKYTDAEGTHKITGSYSIFN